MRFLATISRDEDGMFVAECPSIPGCVSQGKTEEEAEKKSGKLFESAWRFAPSLDWR